MKNEYATLTPASIWIGLKFLNLQNTLQANTENFELAHSIDALYNFLWDYYADWYVEYLKTDDSQIKFAKDLFKQYVTLLSPYMPFESEVLWEKFFGEQTLLAFEKRDEAWIESVLESQDTQSAAEFDKVKSFVEDMRSLRGLFGIDPAKVMTVYTDTPALKNHAQFIKLVAKLDLNSATHDGLYKVVTPDFSYSLDILSHVLDKQKEIHRTEKIITDLNKQIQSLQSQLENEAFLSRAEPEVVEQKRHDLISRKTDLDSQINKLDYLKQSL